MTEILLNRIDFTDKSTIGELLIPSAGLRLVTLEDTARRVKVDGETAIPSGLYQLTLAVSPKFGYCPFILDVPGFSDVRIHWGNDPAATRGCVLVASRKASVPDEVLESMDAYAKLIEALVPLWTAHRKLTLMVNGGIPASDFAAPV